MNQLSLLVVESDAGVSRMFADVFSDRSWKVDVCLDGESAYRAISSDRHYDVIVVSYQVPGSSGVQLTKLARSLDHRSSTPVVMITGSGDIEREAFSAGVNEVWHKPMDLFAFIRAVEKYVGVATCHNREHA
ncbi:MAG: response regulator [Acidobacteriota bacterium]